MKSLKLISASLLAVSIAGFASAATIIRISGSSAFRSAAVQAEIDLVSFDATGVAQAAVMATKGTGGVPDAKADGLSIVHGWLNDVAHTEVYFENNWTGSAAGVIDLTSGNTTLAWYNTSVPMSVYPGTLVATTGNTSTGAPGMAFSDVSASEVVSSIASAGTKGIAFGAGINAAAIVDAPTVPAPIAAVPFQWVMGVQSVAAPFTNITQEQASSLISNGAVALSVFTGNSADALDFVIFTGRNEDSGTRIAYMGESQLQPQFGAAPLQYMLKQDALAYPANNAYTSLAAGTTITGMQLWPANWPVNTVSTLNWKTTGHSGYNGGGDVVAVLKTNNPVTGFTKVTNPDLPAAWVDGTSRAFFVSCLGVSDAAKVTAVGGTGLSYNGVPYNTNKLAVGAGQYSLYTIEHAYRLTAATGTQVVADSYVANTLADKLVADTSAQLGAGGVALSDVHGLRNGTGAPIK